MFKRISTAPDILAYEISGEITAADVDQVYEDLGQALTNHERVSVYAELLDEFDIEGAAVWRDLTRAHEVLGRLKQFDRIAFVAERSWITAIARIEEALLSLFDVEMHVFDPAEREHAMAWVKGEIEEEHAPAIRQLSSDDANIAIFEIDGKMRKSDMDVAKNILTNFLTDEQPRNLLAIVKNFKGFELAILADRELFKLKIEAAKHLDRYAFVGAPKWLEGYIDAMDVLLKPELRTFDADERDEALAWLRQDQLVA